MVAVKTKEPISSDGWLLNETVRKLNDLGVLATPRQIRLWDNLVNPAKDVSRYRKFTYEDINKIVFIFVINKILKISLPRIKNIMVCLGSEQELQVLLQKNPLTLMSKYRDENGKERWYLKRELRDDLEYIQDSLKKFDEGLKRFREVFSESKGRFYKEALRYQQKSKE